MSRIFLKNYSAKSNNKGSLLVSYLLAAGLVGISAVTLLSYMQGMNKQIQEIEQRQDTSFNIHPNIISSLRALLVSANIDSNGEEQDQNTEGICSFLNRPVKSAGVELLQFNLGSNLSTQAQNSFSHGRWEFFFDKSEYTLMKTSSAYQPCKTIDSHFVSNEFSRCFKYTGMAEEMANEVYVIARIIPKSFPGFTEIDLSQDNTRDVKSVLFELWSQVTVFEGDNHDSTHTSSTKNIGIIWANAVSECHIQSTNNNLVAVQFSGSGPGRLSRNTLINSVDFSPDNLGICSELEFQDIAPHNRVAHVINSDGSIEVNNQRARTACRKKVFRCKGVNSHSSDDYEPVIFTIGLSNDSGGVLNLEKVKVVFVDEEFVEMPAGREGQLTVEVYDRNQHFDANTNLTNISVNPGHNVYKFTVTDQSRHSLKNFCNEVCSGEKIFPSITMNLEKPPRATCKSYSSGYTEDKYRFRCTVCHSKICTKYGVGVFGPIDDDDGFQGLVDEPLDGTLPECSLPENNSDGKYNLPDQHSIPDRGGSCVAIKLPDMDSFQKFDKSNAEYEFHNCRKKLPVLCFAYGHYIPAVTFSSPTSKPTIFQGTFTQGQKACYKMGREVIEKKDLAGLFKQFWAAIAGNTDDEVAGALRLPAFSSDANYFDYVNNAARGIFIAPSYQIDQVSSVFLKAKTGYLRKFLDGEHEAAWVAMRKDGGGQLIGAIPWAEVADSNAAVFRRSHHPFRAILLKNTRTVSSSGTDTVLTHNIQYKGVYNVGSSGQRKALCRKSAGDFALSESTSLKNAPVACSRVGGSFLPPLGSLEWVQAMTLLSPNDEAYPFPDPGDLSGDTSHIYSRSVGLPSIWVALSKKSGSGLATEFWRLSDVYFEDNGSVKSIFKHTEVDIPDKSTKYIGIIDAKGRPFVPTPFNLETFRNGFDLSNIKVACYKNEGNEQVTLKGEEGATVGCASEQTEVKQQWLNKGT